MLFSSMAHQRNMSLRLNSHGLPAVPMMWSSAVAACTLWLNDTICRTTVWSIRGNTVDAIVTISSVDSASTWTFVKRFKNDLGRPFRPPPCPKGFCAAKIRKVGGQVKVSPNSGMKTLARWSKQLFRPSRTDCDARFNSSRSTQSPLLIAERRTPSHQRNDGFPSPVVVSSGTGKSLPIKSDISVCSERLIRVSLWPELAASAAINVVWRVTD